MNDSVKCFVLRILIAICSFLPQTKFIKKIKQKGRMGILYRTDRVMWNVEHARDLGVKIGNDCRLYSCGFFSEPYLVEIGDNVIVSGEVKFVTHDGGIFLLKDKIPDVRGHFGKIIIGNNCFIGMGAILLPNISIGNNCIIGAGSVVMNSFPDNSIIMGNPAKQLFKFEMYSKMKCKNPRTLKHDKYPFPVRIPDDVKKEMLLQHFSKLPDPRPAPNG